MQEDVLKQKLENTYILQPSLIIGNRNENRAGENFAKHIMNIFNFIIPKKYKSIKAQTIAYAMQKIADHGYKKTIIPSDEIQKLGNKD